MLTVLVPWGVHQYSSGTAQAVLDEGARAGRPRVERARAADPIHESNLTRRVDFALFMVAALENDALIDEAPAIVGCRTPSALAYAAGTGGPPSNAADVVLGVHATP